MNKLILAIAAAALMLAAIPIKATPVPMRLAAAQPSLPPNPFLASAPATPSGHYVALTWTLSTDDNATACPSAGVCVYTVYRYLGACSGSMGTATAVTTLPNGTASYNDTNVVVGNQVWYAVTFSVSGVESVYSNTPCAKVRPLPPTGAAAN